MAKISEITLKCGHCGHRFPSPIFAGDSVTLETMITVGNKVECPKCKTMISCNKQNMAWRWEDGSGGGMYDEWGDK